VATHFFSQNQFQCSADAQEKHLIGTRNTLQPGDSGEENYLIWVKILTRNTGE
jgi:hypothetical protein